MGGIDVQISMSNVPQLDRHQNDTHRQPVIHQVQNAAMAEEAAHRRVAMPVEPDAAEKKNVDPEDGKRDTGRRNTRKKAPVSPESGKKNNERNGMHHNSDHLIDLQI